MEIKSQDTKKLVIENEKGDIILLLPIGLNLEEGLDAVSHFTGAFAKALELYKEKKAEEEKDGGDKSED